MGPGVGSPHSPRRGADWGTRELFGPEIVLVSYRSLDVRTWRILIHARRRWRQLVERLRTNEPWLLGGSRIFDAVDVRVGRVACANSTVYFEPPGCFGPFIYGQVASPDLNGSGRVDGADIAVFANFLGDPVTLESGWQADFNHVGSFVNAGDLAYLAGRMDKECLEGQQKVGVNNYQMDVENLMREDLRSFMAQHDITVAQILAAWDDMGFTYDSTAAVRILTSDESANQSSSWSELKTLYR